MTDIVEIMDALAWDCKANHGVYPCNYYDVSVCQQDDYYRKDGPFGGRRCFCECHGRKR